MKLFENISGRWRDLFSPVSNETIKVVVLCVVTATTFWFFNALNDNYTTRISYPISFSYPDSSLLVVTELPDNVKINVSGGGWNLLRKTFWFTIDPVEINLDNPAVEKYFLGSSLYPTIADQLNEIQLNFIETDTLYVDIDSIATKKVALKFDSANVNLADDHKIVSNINISKDSASFTGPKRFISQIPEVVTLKTDKTKLQKNFKEEIALDTYGSSLVRRDPVEVEVSFEVAKFIKQELMLPFNKINTPKDSSQYIFRDSLASLNFIIQEQLANQYSLDSFNIVIDFNGLSPNDSLAYPKIMQHPEQIKKDKIKLRPLLYKYEQN